MTHRRSWARLADVLLAMVAVWPQSTIAHAAQGVWPIGGQVVAEFDPPPEPWLPGHRGIDIAGDAGAWVVAAADGIVTFAGDVAGRGVIVVDHGSTRSTYEPVVPLVRVGSPVVAGDILGLLVMGHDCPAPACLHWGLKAGDVYLDPRSLLGVAPIRLLPLGDWPNASLARTATTSAVVDGDQSDDQHRGVGRSVLFGCLSP